MCGIIGYTGTKNNAKEVLLSGLKKLEYRGYDSAGIAVYENEKINLYKSTGKIKNLEESLSKNTSTLNLGIGHTRWATHGVPNETNAHPHKCGNVTLVHNGIIENYLELKQDLILKGTEFKTQTDTEVACAYINEIYKTEKNKIKCIAQSCKNFRGSYAFAIIFDDEPDTIYAVRKDSPLVIGVGASDENFISSDISAILNYTNRYILLEHEEFAKISKDSIEIFNSNLEKIEKEILTATWSSSEYQKSGFDHFMLKEINEQPKVLKQVFERYFSNNTYDQNIDISNYDNIHIVACGSAMHAGLVGKFLFEKYALIPVTVEVASEYRYKNQLITNNTLVIIISQSGETADTLAALRIAKQKGAHTLGIVNAVGSTISRESDITIYTHAGPEIAVATTKGYASQVAVLSTLALNTAIKKGLIDKTFEEHIYNDFKNIQNTISDVIKNYEEEYKKVSEYIYKHDHLFYIGRGIDNAVCLEGSLKLKEISYMHSEAYAAGELKHGTISLIEQGTPLIAVATDEILFEKTVSNVKETKARGSFVVFITTRDLEDKYIKSVEDTSGFFDIKLVLPSATDFTQALVTMVALQLIAYKTAILRDCDIDQPRNLAKSVTVE
ncbi:MAG: glutamine--fructose-6-phosphate transaminase (isomerizing) [Clostridia bacterium]|nr:glutamine--fructose-6-phosphate transaminase (isomerizing) [Clostridia bacterium]